MVRTQTLPIVCVFEFAFFTAMRFIVKNYSNVLNSFTVINVINNLLQRQYLSPKVI